MIQLKQFLNERAQLLYRKYNKESVNIQHKLTEQNKNVYQEAFYHALQQNNHFNDKQSPLQSQLELSSGEKKGSSNSMYKDFGLDYDCGKIIGVYGWMHKAEEAKSLRLNLIKIIHEQNLQQNNQTKKNGRSAGISLVFFCRGMMKIHNKSKQKMSFSRFKAKVLKNIEFKYLKYIKKIFVCHERLFKKTISFDSNIINSVLTYLDFHERLLHTFVQYCDSLEDLVEELGPLFQCLRIRDQVQYFNGCWKWMQIFSQEEKKLASEKLIVKKENEKCFYPYLSFYRLQPQTKTPVLFQSLISFMQQTPKILKHQGIFLKPSNKNKLQNLFSDISKINYLFSKRKQRRPIKQQSLIELSQILNKYEPETISCFVKSFFDFLDPPLIKFQVYDTIVERLEENQCQTEQKNIDEDAIAIYKEIIVYIFREIGQIEKRVLLRFAKFLKDSIIGNEAYNKMSGYSISVVIAPCLFKPKVYKVNDLAYTPKLAKILQCIIENNELLYTQLL